MLFGYFTIGLLHTWKLQIVLSAKELSGTPATEQGVVIPNVVCIITSIDSGVMPRYKPLNGLPFSIDFVCLTAFYFLIGYTMREKIATFNNVKEKWLLFFMATITFLSLHYFFNYTIEFDTRIYGNLLICSAEALCGIYITLAVSRIISKKEMPGNALANIGSGSLFIFLFHSFIQNNLFRYLHGVVNLGPYLSSFIAFPLAVCVPLLLWEDS